MGLDFEKLLAYDIPEVEHRLTARDTMLYALGIGLGQDPCSAQQLAFVFDENLCALPTMAVTLAYPGAWYERANAGATRSKSLHGEQGFRIHQPLPVEGTVVGKTRCIGVVDKGNGRGALLYTECEVRNKADASPVCTLTSTTFLRADGGFGGPTGPIKIPHALPARAADYICDLQTRPETALIYRLSGDYNPLHADPVYARKSGFNAPILHGRATFGVAGHALLRAVCGYSPERLSEMSARFSAPVYPGETIRTEVWVDGTVASFRASVLERGVAVLTNGYAKVV